jgi:hypothetical protein
MILAVLLLVLAHHLAVRLKHAGALPSARSAQRLPASWKTADAGDQTGR